MDLLRSCYSFIQHRRQCDDNFDYDTEMYEEELDVCVPDGDGCSRHVRGDSRDHTGMVRPDGHYVCVGDRSVRL